jgi:hypothetical protein
MYWYAYIIDIYIQDNNNIKGTVSQESERDEPMEQ